MRLWRLHNRSSRTGAIGCAVLNIPFGILLVLGGFYLAYHSEARLTDHGEIFASIEPMSADAVKAMAEGETVKFRGMPEPDSLIPVEHYDKDVIFYRVTLEEYVREEDEDGVSYDWETQETDEKFAGFTIDGVRVRPRDAKVVGTREVFQGVRSPAVPPRPFRQISQYDPRVGDERLTVNIIDADQELSIFGNIEDGTVHGGSTFVISALADEATISTLKGEYRVWYWISKAGAVFAIAFGLLMLGGPLSSLVGSLTGGSGGSCGFAALCFVFAGVAVFIVSLLSHGLLSALAAAIGVAVLIMIMIFRKRKMAAAATPEPSYIKSADYTSASVPEPVSTSMDQSLPASEWSETQKTEAPKHFCTACGAELSDADRVCPNCGTKPAS